MGLLRIFNSSDDQKLYTTYALGYEDKTVRELFSADTLSIEYVLMQRNLAGGHMRLPWVRVLAGSYSLRIGMFAADRTQLAYQNTFTNQDEYIKSGDLWLGDTAALAAVNATPFQAACSFEIEITDSAGRDRVLYREEITFKKGLISASAPAVTPGEVAATVAFVKQTAVPKDGSDPLNPNNNIVMKSIPSGFPMMLVVNDDGTVVAIPQ